ncbi:MAG: penicillin-binding protein activator LpoB [Desulfobulbaceae bacterium]|nr:penicillin-binding protein activator LpoB [Desulfobulbaceae bacterium]
MKTKYFLLCVVAILLFSLSGCAGNGSTERSYVREGVDLGYITRVAVLPFANNTRDTFSAQRVRDITTTQILAMGLFDVVDKGVVDSAMREMGISDNTPLDVPLVSRLGQRLGVEGFIVGEVNDIGENRQGSFSYTEASFTLQLLDSETAQVLWRSSDGLDGYSLADRLFGLEPMDTFEVTVNLLRRMLATIPK